MFFFFYSNISTRKKKMSSTIIQNDITSILAQLNLPPAPPLTEPQIESFNTQLNSCISNASLATVPADFRINALLNNSAALLNAMPTLTTPSTTFIAGLNNINNLGIYPYITSSIFYSEELADALQTFIQSATGISDADRFSLFSVLLNNNLLQSNLYAASEAANEVEALLSAAQSIIDNPLTMFTDGEKTAIVSQLVEMAQALY